MRGTITVILSRFMYAVAVIVTVVLVKQAEGACRVDSECKKWGETCCRRKCRPYIKCEAEGHCIDHYDCVSRNEICVRQRCVKETTHGQNDTVSHSATPKVKYCLNDKDCLQDVRSTNRGFNICCIGQCQKTCIFPTVLKRNRSTSRTAKPACLDGECKGNCTQTSCKSISTTVATEVNVKLSNTDYSNSRSKRELPLNPAIIAAIVIAGCIVLTITGICVLREKRLIRKHSDRRRCERHQAYNGSQPFWISRLTRNNTQSASAPRSQRDEEATISFTEPNLSPPGLEAECFCDHSQFVAPPSYSTLTIAECPPTYEEAVRTRHDQEVQANLFV